MIAAPESSSAPESAPRDFTPGYRMWAELVEFTFRMALSTHQGSDEERDAALQEWGKALALENRDRDLAWDRISRALTACGR